MIEFDWKQLRKDLRWGDNMTKYRSFGSQPMTQKERAEILGLSQSKLSRIESNADKNLKVQDLVSICNKINVNPEKYFKNG